MANNLKFVILCCIFLLFSSCSKAPDENESKKNKNSRKTSMSQLNKPYTVQIKNLILTSSEVGIQYAQKTSYYKDRASLKFLKRPVNGVEIIRQDFEHKENPSDSTKLTVLILKYKSIEQAKKEIDLNLNILENLAKKENIDSFQINVFGDQSMAIKFQTLQNPFYLYSRYGNIVVKINGGKDSHMKKLLEILTAIENKLN